MRRNRNVVLGIIVVAMVGLFLLPESGFCSQIVLDIFVDGINYQEHFGNWGIVNLDVKEGVADFNIWIIGEFQGVRFSTSVEGLQPEDFSYAPVGFDEFGWWADWPNEKIINPNIHSDSIFDGFTVWAGYIYLPNVPFNWGYAYNSGHFYPQVPEPATLLLLGSGLIGLAGFARRKFKK